LKGENQRELKIYKVEGLEEMTKMMQMVYERNQTLLKGMLLARTDENNVKGLLSFFLDSYM
jgi:hypothetical protein